MIFGIFKVSHAGPRDGRLATILAGAGFFVRPNLAVTAHHVLHDAKLEPDQGLPFAQHFLYVAHNDVRPMARVRLYPCPEIDATFIRFPGPVTQSLVGLGEAIAPGEQVEVHGFRAPEGDITWAVRWQGNKLVIDQLPLEHLRVANLGPVTNVAKGDIKTAKIEVADRDVLVADVASPRACAGGPILRAGTLEAVGLNVAGEPVNAPDKRTTIAVRANELSARMEALRLK